MGWSGRVVKDARHCTNNGAECGALMIAACWAFSLPPGIFVEIVADSRFAIDCADGGIASSQFEPDSPFVIVR